MITIRYPQSVPGRLPVSRRFLRDIPNAGGKSPAIKGPLSSTQLELDMLVSLPSSLLDRVRSRRPSAAAFTLVELLVVIGIIALLISILLPALGRAQSQARKVKCLSNLKSIGQTLAIYAAENKGSLPFGWAAANMSSPSTASTGEYWDWVAVVDNILSKKSRPNGLATGVNYGSATKYPAVSEVLMCPDQDRDAFRAATSYQMHPVALPGYIAEFQRNFFETEVRDPTKEKLSPAKLSQLYNDNLLGWDSHVFDSPNVDRVPRTDWYQPMASESCIDLNNLSKPTSPNLRYRIRGRDLFASQPLVGQGKQILLMKTLADGGDEDFGFNRDPLDGFIDNSQLGNLRFRHAKQSECNVLMADFSVKTYKFDRRSTSPDYADSYKINIRRFELRIKRPSGI